MTSEPLHPLEPQPFSKIDVLTDFFEEQGLLYFDLGNLDESSGGIYTARQLAGSVNRQPGKWMRIPLATDLNGDQQIPTLLTKGTRIVLNQVRITPENIEFKVSVIRKLRESQTGVILSIDQLNDLADNYIE